MMTTTREQEIEQLAQEAMRVAREYGLMRATDEEVETAIDNLACAAIRNEPRPSSSGQAVEARGLPPLPVIPHEVPTSACDAVFKYAKAYARDALLQAAAIQQDAEISARAALAAQADARREDTAMLLDAKRYRWLRELDWCKNVDHTVKGEDSMEINMLLAPQHQDDNAFDVDIPECLDAAIDAAMNTTKGADHAE